MKQLKLILSKETWDKYSIPIMDNAKIHWTNKIVREIKHNKIVIIKFSSYSSKLNKINNTFGRLKQDILLKLKKL